MKAKSLDMIDGWHQDPIQNRFSLIGVGGGVTKIHFGLVSMFARGWGKEIVSSVYVRKSDWYLLGFCPGLYWLQSMRAIDNGR